MLTADQLEAAEIWFLCACFVPLMVQYAWDLGIELLTPIDPLHVQDWDVLDGKHPWEFTE